MIFNHESKFNIFRSDGKTIVWTIQTISEMGIKITYDQNKSQIMRGWVSVAREM